MLCLFLAVPLVGHGSVILVLSGSTDLGFFYFTSVTFNRQY